MIKLLQNFDFALIGFITRPIRAGHCKAEFFDYNLLVVIKRSRQVGNAPCFPVAP